MTSDEKNVFRKHCKVSPVEFLGSYNYTILEWADCQITQTTFFKRNGNSLLLKTSTSVVIILFHILSRATSLRAPNFGGLGT